MEGLIEGRIVHYVLLNGQHRAAIVVRVFDEHAKEAGLVNLLVFADGSNDKGVIFGNASEQGIFWATSAQYDPEGTKHHTWHWVEKA
jgi:hypothetical protein